MNRRELLAACAAGAVAAAAPAIAVAQGRPAGGPEPAAETFISTLSQRGISSLTGRNTSEAERARRFRALLVENFDVPTIGRFVIGRYWRVATEAERQEYMSLFTDMLVATYANRFGDYQGEQMRTAGSRTTPEGDIIVTSEFARPGTQGPPTRIEWFMRRDGASFRIVDVRVEGVSMAITQRDEYGSIIQRGGGQMSALLAVMRQRSAQVAR